MHAILLLQDFCVFQLPPLLWLNFINYVKINYILFLMEGYLIHSDTVGRTEFHLALLVEILPQDRSAFLKRKKWIEQWHNDKRRSHQ